jgi:hypothetical protein
MTEDGYIEVEFPWDIIPGDATEGTLARCQAILKDNMNDPLCTVEQT